MLALLQLVILTAATLMAGAAALTLYWLCLEAAFQFIHPARDQEASARAGLAQGTLRVVRAYTSRR